LWANQEIRINMTIKLSNKVLGILGTAALAVSTLAGVAAPANAAGAENLVLAPATGSAFTVPSETAFTLKAYYKPGVSATNAANLKVRYTKQGAFQLNRNAGDAGTLADAKTTVTTPVMASSVAGATVSGGTTSVDYFGIAVDSAVHTSTYTVVAQAFEDADGSGTLNGDESFSAPQTITFLKTADITWTTSLTQPYVGDALKAVASVTSNVNISLLANGDGSDNTTNAVQVFGAFSDDSTTPTTLADTDTTVLGATYNSTKDQYDFTSTANYAAPLAAGDTVKLSIWFTASDLLVSIATQDTALKSGSKSHSDPAVTVSASATKTALAAQVASLGAVSTVAGAGTGPTAAGASKVASGSGSFQVRTLAVPVSGVSKSGHSVTFTVREDTANDLHSGAVITVGAGSLTNSNAGTVQSGFETTATTDADGYATITVSYTGTKDGDEIDIDASIMGVDAAENNVEFADRTVSAVYNVTAIGTSEPYNVPVETPYSIVSSVVDQFGAAVSEVGYSVKATYGGVNIVAAVSGGLATLSMPAVTAASTLSVTLQGQKNGADVGSTETVIVKIGSTSGAVANVTYSTVLTGAGAGYGVGTDADLAINTKTFTNVDTRKSGFAPSLDAAYSTLTVTALKADSSVAAGSDITLSGEYLDFLVDGVYSSNSITVKTNGSGTATVRIYSSVSGSKTLTFTSGTTVKTQALVYAAGAVSGATALVINAPSFAPAGKTLAVTGGATDKYGNYVTATDFEVTYSGAGFYSALPTSLTNGKFSFNALLGSNDSGTVTITASIYTGNDKITVTKTVIIGEPAADQKVNVGTFSGKLVVYALNASGSEVSYKIAGKWVTQVVTSDLLMRYDRVVGATGKTIKVDIYVDGVLKLAKSVVTK
jgi:hypothetical protein